MHRPSQRTSVSCSLLHSRAPVYKTFLAKMWSSSPSFPLPSCLRGCRSRRRPPVHIRETQGARKESGKLEIFYFGRSYDWGLKADQAGEQFRRGQRRAHGAKNNEHHACARQRDGELAGTSSFRFAAMRRARVTFGLRLVGWSPYQITGTATQHSRCFSTATDATAKPSMLIPSARAKDTI